MKIFRILSVIAIIVILLGVTYTGIAAYDTMETAKSISVSDYKSGLSGSGINASALISGKNAGFFTSKIIVNNNTLNFRPGIEEHKRIYFNESFSTLMNNGWPLNNVSVYKNVSITTPSYLFNASSNIEKYYNLGAPFHDFKVINSSLIGSNKTYKIYNITTSFHDYLNYNIGKINGYKPLIQILYNNSTAGIIKNITLSYNKIYQYNGTLELPSGVKYANLTFALPGTDIKWEEKNVKIN